MLDEEIEKKSAFTKMLDAARQMVSKSIESVKTEKTIEEKKEAESSQIVNEYDAEAKKLIKPGDAECEDEFQISFSQDDDE